MIEQLRETYVNDNDDEEEEEEGEEDESVYTYDESEDFTSDKARKKQDAIDPFILLGSCSLSA